MSGPRFFWKIYGSTVALILLTAAIFGWQVGKRLVDESFDEFRTRLFEHATLIQPSLDAGGGRLPAETEARMQRLRADTGVRYTLGRADGRVLVDSDRDARELPGHADRPEVRAALDGREGFAVRHSETLQTKMMYVALPVEAPGDVAWVRTSLPLVELDQRRSDFQRTVFLSVLLACVVGVALGWLVARSVTQPLRRMSRAARAMAAGDVDLRLPAHDNDEIGALGRSLNLMASQSRERFESLREDRNKLQAVLGGMVEGVVAVDSDESVLILNRAAAKLLQADPEKAIGQSLHDVTRVHGIADVITETLESGVDQSRELLLPGFAQDRILEVHAAPLRAPGNDEMGAILVLHDVTELRRLEGVRRDFVANVSHELKTPLTAIRGILETILDDEEMPEATQRRFLGKLDDHSRRLVQIVTDLLNLTRVESRPEGLVREPLDFRLPLRASLRALEGAADERKVRLVASLPDEPLAILGDRPSLRLVTDNLIDNAVKYTPAGGEVRVSLAKESEEWLVLEVRDTGVGIAEKHRERVFERFYRVDKARSRELGGTGLGLSIVKHVSLAHGGDVELESTLGEGSTFRVRLPLSREARTTLEQPEADRIAAEN